MQAYFDQLDRVRYEGSKSSNPLAFRHYNPDELVLGKRMEEHLRFAACYWHTFCWNGADMFGVGAFNRPWQQPGEALALAKRKADVAFEFFHKLHVPFYCFHDVDVSPEGASLKEYINNFAQMVDVLAGKQEESGVKCCGEPPTALQTLATARVRRRTQILKSSAGRQRKLLQRWKQPINWAVKTMSCGAVVKVTKRC